MNFLEDGYISVGLFIIWTFLVCSIAYRVGYRHGLRDYLEAVRMRLYTWSVFPRTADEIADMLHSVVNPEKKKRLRDRVKDWWREIKADRRK